MVAVGAMGVVGDEKRTVLTITTVPMSGHGKSFVLLEQGNAGMYVNCNCYVSVVDEKSMTS